MKLPQNYIVFDIETTGFDGKKHKCIEIGALKVVDNKPISTFEALLDWDLSEQDYIPHINGITHEEVKQKGHNPDRAFDEFVEFIDGDFWLIGHNIIKFDIPFITLNFPEFESIHDSILDTAVMYKAMKCGIMIKEGENFKDFAKRVLGSKQYYGVKYSMGTAIQEFGLSKEGLTQHRALSDCYLTNQLYQILCQKQKEIGI